MKKHIAYPKIQQFRDVVRAVKLHSAYEGEDGNGEPIFNNKPKPKIKFTGSVKLHGTNASVAFNNEEGMWIQSRKNVITQKKDNAAFAFFVESQKVVIQNLLDELIKKHSIDTSIFTLTLYGEWAGKGIQKGVAIANLEKSWFIFGAKVSKLNDAEFNSYWIDVTNIKNPASKIYNVYDFKTYSVEIDFEEPETAQIELEQITTEVEAQCPIAGAFNIDGVGEGVVWIGEFDNNIYRFKVKGQKHSVTKTKSTAPVDIEKMKNVEEFVDFTMTENRMEQAITEVFLGQPLSNKKIGEVMKWLLNDILAEEINTLVESGLEPRDVNTAITNRARKMFFTALDNDTFGE